MFACDCVCMGGGELFVIVICVYGVCTTELTRKTTFLCFPVQLCDQLMSGNIDRTIKAILTLRDDLPDPTPLKVIGTLLNGAGREIQQSASQCCIFFVLVFFFHHCYINLSDQAVLPKSWCNAANCTQAAADIRLDSIFFTEFAGS